jgi:hypothetical protein
MLVFTGPHDVTSRNMIIFIMKDARNTNLMQHVYKMHRQVMVASCHSIRNATGLVM